MVRIARLPAPVRAGQATTLGEAFVNSRTRTGALATVYANRVADLAAVCGVRAGLLLGRAMAHEIAHLLLGTREHAHAGLMRAHWPADVIRDAQDETWQLTPPEALVVREAVRTRPSMPAGGQP
jgi:hypothetical protein